MQSVHFIGIGGISMSALAQILVEQGYIVSGSDINQSEMTMKLESLGIKVYIGHSADNIINPDIIVYTAAISKDNPEFKRALQYTEENPNVLLVDRATLLGKIMKDYKYSICVSGTHGKTTTTSMLATIIEKASLDPTIHVGGYLDSINGNVRTGKSNIFITEACEYVESFLKFFPYIGIILNVEADHLDYYRDLNHIKSSFNKFGKLVPYDGYVIVNSDNKNAIDVVDDLKCNKITFSIKDQNSNFTAKNIKTLPFGGSTFDVYNNNVLLGNLELSIPGEYNIYNALAAIACSSIFKVDFAIIKDALKMFKGAHRRFEKKGVYNGTQIIDDYAHHPTEIKSLLKAAKNTNHSKITAIFQPHTYSRTKSLLNEFCEAFDDADEIIVTDIYAAREKDNGTIHSKDLVELIKNRNKSAMYISSFDEIITYIKNSTKDGDLVLTIGAGTIYQVGEKLLAENIK